MLREPTPSSLTLPMMIWRQLGDNATILFDTNIPNSIIKVVQKKKGRGQEDPGTATMHTTSMAGRQREWWLWHLDVTSWSWSPGQGPYYTSSLWLTLRMIILMQKRRSTSSRQLARGCLSLCYSHKPSWGKPSIGKIHFLSGIARITLIHLLLTTNLYLSQNEKYVKQ